MGKERDYGGFRSWPRRCLGLLQHSHGRDCAAACAGQAVNYWYKVHSEGLMDMYDALRDQLAS